MFKRLSNVKFLLIAVILVASVLRLYKLSVNPPSLFGDELDLGYHAYSILKTGRDYQGNFMPLHFHSLAEWRTPLYLYSAVPTIAVFGITSLGVRLPAVFFGVLSIWMFFLLIKETTKNDKLALLSAILLAISPWHLQYSRAGFEVTELLFFLIGGLYFFFKAINKSGKWMWLSVALLTLTPWIYSTAKLFTPVLFVLLFILFKKEILSLPKRHKLYSLITGLIIGLPIAYSTLFGGGTVRFNYISVFSDPTTETQIGSSREADARSRGEKGFGLTPKMIDRLVHNKYTFWGNMIIKSYLQPFSTEFLFVKGDINLRQSIGMGQLYRIEIAALILGLVFFFSSKSFDFRFKILTGFWILFGVIPSAITREGGNHATRLILILPPLILLIACGWIELVGKLKTNYKYLAAVFITVLYAVSFGFYAHEYYVHYPGASERWWHYGWGPAVWEVKSIDMDYDRVIFSMEVEPAWIFFAGWYQYPPEAWQKDFPIGRDVDVPGFGVISHIDKFYFGSPAPETQIYGLGNYLDSKTLYVANATEVGANLIMDPDATPPKMRLLKSIAYPSGEPAFYIFTGEN